MRPAARHKKPLRVVVGFGLYVLRQRQGDGAAFGWVGQHAHRLRQALDDLFRPGDPVPPSRDRPEAVIDRDGRVAERLDLLQYRVGPAPGKDVAGQQQDGQAIDGGGSGAGDHVGGAGPDRRSAGERAQTVPRLGECGRDVNGGLLVAPYCWNVSPV